MNSFSAVYGVLKKYAMNGDSASAAILHKIQGLEEVSSGRFSVKEALAMYSIRIRTACDAGLAVEGGEEARQRLSELDPSLELEVFHFEGPDRIFSVLLEPLEPKVVACLGVEKKPLPTSFPSILWDGSIDQ